MMNNKSNSGILSSAIACLVCTCALLFNAVRTQATELNITDPVRWGNHATAGYASTGTTITINEQIGSLESNLVFNISGDGTYTNFLSYSGPGTYTGDPRSGSNTLTITLSDMTNFGLLNEAAADAMYRVITWVPSWTDVTGKPTVWTNIASQAYTIITNAPWLPKSAGEDEALTGDLYLPSTSKIGFKGGGLGVSVFLQGDPGESKLYVSGGEADQYIATEDWVGNQGYLDTETDPRLPAHGALGNILRASKVGWESWAPDYLSEGAADLLYGQLEANNNWTMTNTFSEVVVSNGVTIGGVRRTDWPTGGGTFTNLFQGAGTTGSVWSASADTNKYLRGDGTWQDVLTEADADANYVKLTDGVSTNQTFAGTNFWSSGRVHYLPIDADINAYIASAAVADGDTIQLASGTYTISATITVAKRVHLRGQGIGLTTIHSITSFGLAGMIATTTVDGQMFSNFTIRNSGTTATSSDVVFAIGTDARFEDVEILDDGTGNINRANIGFWKVGTRTNTLDILRVEYLGSGAKGNRRFLGDNTGNQTANIRDCHYYVSGQTGGSTFFGAIALNAATSVINVYGGSFVSPDDIGSGIIRVVDGAVNLYGGYYNGSGATVFDLSRAGGTLTVHGPVTLANGTTSGTITYAGTTEAGAGLSVGGVTGITTNVLVDGVTLKFSNGILWGVD